MTVLFVLFGFCLCSCDLFGDGKKEDTTTKPKQEEEKKDGWKDVASPDASTVYNALLRSGTDLVYQGSKDMLNNKGVATVDSKLKLTIGKSDFWITLQGKYKTENAPENTYLAVEMSSAEKMTDDSRVLAFYLLYDKIEKKETFYVALGKDNKVRFAFPSVLSFFPFDVEKKTDKDLAGISAILSYNVITNTPISGKFRRGTAGDEYSYHIDIDFDKTVKNIIDNILPKLPKSEQIKTVIFDLFGIKNNVTDTIPDGKLVIDFQTKNHIISNFQGTADMDLSKTESKLFDGNDLSITLDLTRMDVNNTAAAYSALSIPFVKDKTEQGKYRAFTEASFCMEFPLTEYEDGVPQPKDTTFKAVTKIFQGEGINDYLLIEYIDNKTGNLLRGLYFYRNTVYLYSQEEGTCQCIAAFYLGDLGEFVYKVLQNNLGGTATFDVLEMLAYFFRSISFTEKSITLLITEDFFTKVFYNFYDVGKYGNSLVEEDLLEVEGVQEYQDFVSMNEVIVHLDTDVSFLSVLQDGDAYLSEVNAKLQNVETSKFLTKSAYALELQAQE